MPRPYLAIASVGATLVLFSFFATVVYLSHSANWLPSLIPNLFDHGCQCPSVGRGDEWSKTFYPKAFERIPQFERPSSLVASTDSDSLPASASALLEEISLPPVQFLRVDGKERWYGISMLHQLHCLHMLKAVLFDEGMHSHSRRGLENADDSEESEHWTHCLSYIAQVIFVRPIQGQLGSTSSDADHLRQALVCAADDTIETYEVRELETGQKVAIVNGLGGIHQCRDSSLIRDSVAQSQLHPMQSWHYQNGDTLSSVLANRQFPNATDHH